MSYHEFQVHYEANGVETSYRMLITEQESPDQAWMEAYWHHCERFRKVDFTNLRIIRINV